MLKKILASVGLVLTVGGAGYVGALYSETMHQVDIMQCPVGPTEDSCKPDHIGRGQWILVPQHP